MQESGPYFRKYSLNRPAIRLIFAKILSHSPAFSLRFPLFKQALRQLSVSQDRQISTDHHKISEPVQVEPFRKENCLQGNVNILVNFFSAFSVSYVKRNGGKNSGTNNTFLAYLTISRSYKFKLLTHCYVMWIWAHSKKVGTF